MGFIRANILLLVIIIFMLPFWRPVDHGENKSLNIKVLATTSLVRDLITRVGGDYVEVLSLIEGDIDPHSYEIVKGDSDKFEMADIIFANGLFLEHTASIRNCLDVHNKVVYLGDYVRLVCPDKVISVGGEVDPHIWMDCSIWSICVDCVVKELSIVDPTHGRYFYESGERVKNQLFLLSKEIESSLSNLPDDRKYLVTSHNSFNYFVRGNFGIDDWEERVIAVEGISPDQEISPLDVRRVCNYLIERDIDVIFPEKTLSKTGMHKVVDVCLSKGMHVDLADDVLYGDTLGDKSYEDMMKHNTEVIVRNLYANRGK